MLVAALGSLMTRQPLVTAMNASAAAMTAMRAGDQAAADAKYKEWKEASELAIQQQKFEIETRDKIHQQYKDDQQMLIAKDNAYMNAFCKNTAYDSAQNRDAHMRKLEVIAQKRLYNDQAKAWKIAVERKAYTDALKSPEFQKQLAGAKSEEERTGMKAALASGWSPETVNFYAQQIVAGDKSAWTGLGRSQAAQAALRGAVARMMMDKGLGGDELAARYQRYNFVSAMVKTAGTAAGRIELGVSEMNNLMPQVKQASEELKRTNYPTMNAVIQAAQKEKGNTQLRNLSTRLQGLQAAFSNVLSRGGVPTDGVRAAAKELLDAHDPAAVLEMSMNAMQSEARAVSAAPGDVLKKGSEILTGKSRYATKEDVAAAFQSGEIATEDEALQLLQNLPDEEPQQ
jgi:hypothetical protein